jgi:hypothetical protein
MTTIVTVSVELLQFNLIHKSTTFENEFVHEKQKLIRLWRRNNT